MLQAQLLQGRYQLQEQLGHNAGRQTWLATDVSVSPPELVIVKLLAFNPQMQWDDFKLFEREAQVLKNLNYPQIPKYRDYFSLDKTIGAGLCWFGLVQEYIPGKTLQQLLHQGKRFTENQVRQIATDILNILIYLHELSPPLLHRDIKPSNLIWGEDEQIYLVDFGAVQDSAAAEGVTFTVVGTTGYAPLEQFWGKAVPASDLYALGATLIHLLTGTSPADLPQKNLQIQFSHLISVNPTFICWIQSLTEPDLSQRYSTARLALKDLKAERYLNTPLQKVRQPTGSRIQMWKSPTELKIKISGRGLLFLVDVLGFGGKWLLAAGSIMSLLSLLFILCGLLLFVVVGLVSLFYHKLFILILLMLVGVLIAGNIWLGNNVLYELAKMASKMQLNNLKSLGDDYLHLDQESFVIEKKLFGFCYIRHQGQISEIKKVYKIASKRLNIQTNSCNYSLGRNFTENECNWLAQQIQDWLK